MFLIFFCVIKYMNVSEWNIVKVKKIASGWNIDKAENKIIITMLNHSGNIKYKILDLGAQPFIVLHIQMWTMSPARDQNCNSREKNQIRS